LIGAGIGAGLLLDIRRDSQERNMSYAAIEPKDKVDSFESIPIGNIASQVSTVTAHAGRSGLWRNVGMKFLDFGIGLGTSAGQALIQKEIMGDGNGSSVEQILLPSGAGNIPGTVPGNSPSPTPTTSAEPETGAKMDPAMKTALVAGAGVVGSILLFKLAKSTLKLVAVGAAVAGGVYVITKNN